MRIFATMKLKLGAWSIAGAWALAVGSALGLDLTELGRVQAAVQAKLSEVNPAVVALDAETGAASGVIVTAEGLVLTAAHVVESMKEVRGEAPVQVMLADGSQVAAKLLGRDPHSDAGMIQLLGSRKTWPHAKLASGPQQAGSWCFALGHPGGYDRARGTVLRVGKVVKPSAQAIQTDCVLMGGDSGGPLFDLKGEVIGIHSQIYEARDENVHVGVAPFLRAWAALQGGAVLGDGQNEAGWLGMAAGASGDAGVTVAHLAEESPARRAGLALGDQVIAVGEREVKTEAELVHQLACQTVGQAVELVVKRGGQVLHLEATLSPRPTDS
jgi:serine protease Do